MDVEEIFTETIESTEAKISELLQKLSISESTDFIELEKKKTKMNEKGKKHKKI